MKYIHVHCCSGWWSQVDQRNRGRWTAAGCTCDRRRSGEVVCPESSGCNVNKTVQHSLITGVCSKRRSARRQELNRIPACPHEHCKHPHPVSAASVPILTTSVPIPTPSTQFHNSECRHWAEYTGWSKKMAPTGFCQNFTKSPTNLIIFGTQMAKMIENYVRYTHCPPHPTYVNALPCKIQMLQIVA